MKPLRPIVLPSGCPLILDEKPVDFSTPEWAARRQAVEDACVRMSAERSQKGRDAGDVLAGTKGGATRERLFGEEEGEGGET